VYWLVVPLADQDVLLDNERVLYRSRRHWATILSHFGELVAVMFLRVALDVNEAWGFQTILFCGVVGSVLVLRPLLEREKWGNSVWLFLGLFLLWAVKSDVSLGVLANLVVAYMAVRFAVRTLRWARFQLLYVTDRRVMETDGFLGVTVNSMPLKSITDTQLRRTAMGEVLGYGTFHVESAGQEQALGNIDFIVDPEAFHESIVGSWDRRGSTT
jgi:hypothetical protein